MKKQKVRVGVVGCGGICKATYMDNMVKKFDIIEVIGVADLIDTRAQWIADKYHVEKMSLQELMEDPQIEVVVNLTYPESHVEITRMAFEHGKHVFCEKMMAPSFEEASELMRLASEKGLLYTTAPDTFLGAWEQSARKYLDDGIIGEARTVHAQITMHYALETPFFDLAPNYFFFPLHHGGGFPFDLGGYFLHEMINLFGSVKRVTGFGGNLFPERVYENPKHPKYGEAFHVDTPTTLMAALEFENGVLGTFHISSDSFMSRSFVVTGTNGTMHLGDPNAFCDVISITRAGAKPPVERLLPGQQPGGKGQQLTQTDDDVQTLAEMAPIATVELPLLHGFYDSLRGVGLADMCYAIRNNRRPRCHADIGYHAMEIISGIQRSCETGKIYEMTTRCDRPQPLAPSSYPESCQERVLDD